MFPELERFENDRERKQVLKQYQWKVLHNWKRFCAFAATLALFVAGITVLPVLSSRVINLPVWVNIGLVGGLTGGLVGGMLRWLLCNPMRKHLREQLIARGVPICLRCGYDLRGQSEPRCPECGGAFDERLLSEPRT